MGPQRERRQTADERCRAFTLLFKAYEELRRAIVFARWAKGDGEELAPSLHAVPGAGRPKKQRKQPLQAESLDATDDESAPDTASLANEN
jgi:hypothetical protein